MRASVCSTDLSLRWVESLERHRGGLLNVASIAGFFPGPGMAVYYATKAYALAFSEALHRELAPRGVRVTVLCPGPVPTEFQARAGIDERRAKGLLACSAEQVARAGFHGFMRGRRLVVPGLATKLLSVLPRFVPRGVLLSMIHGIQQAPAKAVEPPGWPRRRSHRS